MQWIEISSEYSGLFFRVLGENSAPFGETQNDSSPRLIEVRSYGVYPPNYNHIVDIVADGNWSENLFSGSFTGGYSYANNFKVSSGEVRPRNKAVRVWKRSS